MGGTITQSSSVDSAQETESEHRIVGVLGSNLMITKMNRL